MKNKIKEKTTALKKKIILEEAQSYIDEKGYQNFKINELSNFCSISVGTFYQLFVSKENFFHEYALFQMDKFYNKLLEVSSLTNSPKEKILIYTKLKLQAFREKSKVVKEHIAYDPLFILKLGNQNQAENIIENFLAKEFKNLSKEISFKTNNYTYLSYLYSAYTLGFIKYYFQKNPNKENIECSSNEILDNFLNGHCIKMEKK